MENLENYKGYDIIIAQDSCPQNPFTDWDCEFPLMWNSFRDESDYSDGNIDRFLTEYLSTNQISYHQKKILDLICYDSEWLDDYYPSNEYDKADRAEYLRDELNEWICDSIENRADFCELFNIKHYSGTSMGYSQSDWANVFICWTPEFEKITGLSYNKVTDEMLESSFELFGHYAWGDVFGYQISHNGEDLDSRWGYYGDDHEKNGLLEQARNMIDYYLETVEKKELPN